MTDTTNAVEVFTSEQEILDLAPIVKEQADSFAIETLDDYNALEVAIVAWLERVKAIERYFADDKKKASELHKSICKKEKDAVEMYMPPIRAAMERRKVWREAREAEDAARQKQATEVAHAKQKEELTEQATSLAARGETAAARVVTQIIENAPAPTVTVASSIPTSKTSKVTKKYDYEIVTPGLVPRNLCDPSDKKIKAQVAAFGSEAVIPGVRVFEVSNETFRIPKKK